MPGLNAEAATSRGPGGGGLRYRASLPGDGNIAARSYGSIFSQGRPSGIVEKLLTSCPSVEMRGGSFLPPSRASQVAVEAITRLRSTVLLENEATTSWIETPQANIFFSGLIVANMFSIGLETDLRPDTLSLADPSYIPWFLLESFFAMAFLFEIVLRYLAQRAAFWRVPYNIFDTAIVILSVVEVWVLIPLTGTEKSFRAWSLLRALRLLRLLRVLRIFRYFKKLADLLAVMAKVSSNLLWFLLMTLMLVYVCAIFTTLVLGQAGFDMSGPREELQTEWGTVPKSMFTLFVMLTGEAWYDIAMEAMGFESWTWIFFVPYMSLMNFVIVNLFVGLMCERVHEMSRKREEELRVKADNEMLKGLASIFVQLDTDGDFEISISELREALEDDDFRRQLEKLNIFLGSDADFLMKYWDVNDDHKVQFKEFVSGAVMLQNEEVSAQLMHLHRDLMSYGDRILQVIDGGARPSEREPKEAKARGFSESTTGSALDEELIVQAVGRALDDRLAAERRRMEAMFAEERALLRQELAADLQSFVQSTFSGWMSNGQTSEVLADVARAEEESTDGGGGSPVMSRRWVSYVSTTPVLCGVDPGSGSMHPPQVGGPRINGKAAAAAPPPPGLAGGAEEAASSSTPPPSILGNVGIGQLSEPVASGNRILSQSRSPDVGADAAGAASAISPAAGREVPEVRGKKPRRTTTRRRTSPPGVDTSLPESVSDDLAASADAYPQSDVLPEAVGPTDATTTTT